MADVTATVGQSNSTTASIGVNTASGPQTVSVSLPSAQAAQNSSLQLKLLGDVDTTTLNDGEYYNIGQVTQSLLQQMR